MATPRFTCPFDLGPQSAVVATADDSNFTSISGSPFYDASTALHGAFGMRTSNAAAEGVFINLGTNPETHTVSAYARVNTAPTTSAARWIRFTTTGNSTCAELRFNSSGKIDVAGPGAAALATATISYPTGVPIRADVQFDASVSSVYTLTVKLFYGSNSEGTVPDETIGPVTTPTTANVFGRWAYGCVGTTIARDITYDTFRVYDGLVTPDPFNASTNVSLTGPAAAVAVAAPAGSVTAGGNVSVTGPAAALTVAAPAGSVSVIAPSLVNATQEVSQTTLEVAAKVANTSSLVLKVSASSGMTSPVYTSGTLTPDSFGYVHPVATGLSAGTVYYWQFYNSGTAFGGVHTTKTLFATGTPTGFKVAFGGCVTNNNTESRALADLISWAPDFWLHLGDFHYHNPTATVTATHLGFFEDQYANSTGGELALACQNIPLFYNRSDHDAGPSDNGPSNLTDDPGNANSIAATQEFFPVGSLADTRSPKVGLYRSWVVGRIKFIQIDVRNTDRTRVTSTGTSTDTMLGATQLAWLKAQLVTSEPFKVIISDTQWMGADDNTGGVPVKGDWWPAYPHERSDLISYIAAHPEIGHVELWHSDAHLLGYATATDNTWGNFPVLAAAPFANIGGGRDQSTFTAFYSTGSSNGSQYGRVTFTDDGTTITRTYDGYDAINATTQISNTVTVAATTVTGPTVALSVAVPAGTVSTTENVSITGPAAAVSLAAPAGSLSITRAPGSYGAGDYGSDVYGGSADASVTGPTVTLTSAALAGSSAATSTVTLTASPAALSVAAAAGSVAVTTTVTVTAPVATITFTAPPGGISAGGSATVSGSAPDLSLAVPAGTVSGTRNVAVTAPTLSIALTAPAGTVAGSVSVSISGTASAVTIAAVAGTATTVASATVTGPLCGLGIAAVPGTLDGDVTKRDINFTTSIGPRRWVTSIGDRILT